MTVVIVRDFMVDHVITTQPGENLNQALHKLNEHGLHEIPVVEADDDRRVMAMLTRNNLGAAYHKRLHALRRPTGTFALQPFEQRAVLSGLVHPVERGCLIRDFVCGRHGTLLGAARAGGRDAFRRCSAA